MAEEFDTPSTGVKITDFEGCLLLVTPREQQEDIQTQYGPADAIRADVTVLDGEHRGEYTDLLIFQKQLQGQLRPKVGAERPTLGRLGRGEAKRGQSAPWILEDPTDDDKRTAHEYMRAHED